jgi:hypothetical protein
LDTIFTFAIMFNMFTKVIRWCHNVKHSFVFIRSRVQI